MQFPEGNLARSSGTPSRLKDRRGSLLQNLALFGSVLLPSVPFLAACGAQQEIQGSGVKKDPNGTTVEVIRPDSGAHAVKNTPQGLETKLPSAIPTTSSKVIQVPIVMDAGAIGGEEQGSDTPQELAKDVMQANIEGHNNWKGYAFWLKRHIHPDFRDSLGLPKEAIIHFGNCDFSSLALGPVNDHVSLPGVPEGTKDVGVVLKPCTPDHLDGARIAAAPFQYQGQMRWGYVGMKSVPASEILP